MPQQTNHTAERPELAFYYPGPVWYTGDWVKSLILFFDGIALLVPEYMKDRPSRVDPAIAAGLTEHGLLHILEPETMVDKAATERLAEAMTNVIVSGALDELTAEDTQFHELSYSRMGGYGDSGLAKMLLDELKSKGLARDSEDGVSIPMHPVVRATFLVLLAQILRPYGSKIGADLSPATDRPQIIGALQELLSLPASPSAGHVVAFDLNTVSVDLSQVPIDEVLDFRREHLKEHRAYARNVRQFVRELSLLPESDRQRAFEDRQAELDELAQQLRSVARKAWRKPASFAMSMAGAAWSVVTGNPVGAAFGAGGAIISALAGQPNEAGAYSYIFRAQQTYM